FIGLRRSGSVGLVSFLFFLLFFSFAPLCVRRFLFFKELLLNETLVLPEALVDDGIGVSSISFCLQPRKTTRSKTRGGCRRRKRTVTVSSESKGQTFFSARRNPPRFFIKIGRTRGMLRLREDEETPE
ncbi:unnamed protein product, partial [Brassica napus]